MDREVTRDAASLADGLASLGPYFAVTLRSTDVSLGAPWRPMRELVGGGPALPARVGTVRAVLAQRAGLAPTQVEERVAASVAQLGLVARLVSPYVGAALLRGPSLRPPALDDVWWQPATGGAFPLCLPTNALAADGSVASPAASPAATASALRSGLVDGPVAELVSAVRRSYGVSPTVLWGNVGSAVNAVATVVVATRPDLAGRAADVVRGVLDHPTLREGVDGVAGTYRRGSCCLIYRASASRSPSAAGVCGDCVLAGRR